MCDKQLTTLTDESCTLFFYLIENDYYKDTDLYTF